MQPPASLSRRSFLKIVAAAGLTLGAGGALSRQFFEPPTCSPLSETRLLMGTLVNLTVIAPDPAVGPAAVRACFQEMERLIGLFDHRLPASPVSQINSQGILLNPPRELLEVLFTARQVSEWTNGAFDITVKPVLDAYSKDKPVTPELARLVDYRRISIDADSVRLTRSGMEITLDGLAKGRVVDGGVACLQACGFENVLVEAGGDLLAEGTRAGGKPWQVGIRSPRAAREPDTIDIIPVSSRAVATSGDYMNTFSADYSQHHIIHPGTLVSPFETASASVVAPTALEADALSTALMVMGPAEGLALVERLPGVEALLVGKDLAVHRSRNFPGRA